MKRCIVASPRACNGATAVPPAPFQGGAGEGVTAPGRAWHD